MFFFEIKLWSSIAGCLGICSHRLLQLSKAWPSQSAETVFGDKPEDPEGGRALVDGLGRSWKGIKLNQAINKSISMHTTFRDANCQLQWDQTAKSPKNRGTDVDDFSAPPRLPHSLAAWVQMFQLSTYSYLFKPIQTYSYLFIPIHTYSYLFKPIQTYSYLFIPIHTYSNLFKPIHTYSYLFKPIQTYSYLFIPIHTYSYLFIPIQP